MLDGRNEEKCLKEKKREGRKEVFVLYFVDNSISASVSKNTSA